MTYSTTVIPILQYKEHDGEIVSMIYTSDNQLDGELIVFND